MPTSHPLPWGVIFDNDGVLVDTEPISIHVYQQALREQGVRPEEVPSEDYCGLTDLDIVQRVQAVLGRKLDAGLFIERKRALYFEEARKQGIRPFPGAEALVRALHQQGIPVALASSASPEKIRFNLEWTSVADFFSAIISGEDFERGKPDPQIFLEAASRMDVPPARCAVIEDSLNGLLAAQRAGMTPVAVVNSFPEDTLRTRTDHIFQTLEGITPTDILRLIEST